VTLYQNSDVTRSSDVNNQGGGVKDLMTSYINKGAERHCLQWSRGLNKEGQ